MGMRKLGFTLVELLVCIAVIAIMAALLLPAFARAKAKSQQAACLVHLRQIGIGFDLELADSEDRLPDRRDLKDALGYQPWTTWPPSDPRGGWAAVVLAQKVPSDRIWFCPAMKKSAVRTAPQSLQESRPGDADSQVSYWFWRFDRTNNPVPLDNFWGKTVERSVSDLQTLASPFIGTPTGPADVELAVDPYFPNTIAALPADIRGRAVHLRGRNRLFLDGHAEFLRDPRTL